MPQASRILRLGSRSLSSEQTRSDQEAVHAGEYKEDTAMCKNHLDVDFRHGA
ncbi:hypothetical protein Terro_2786 [Terriglobus roseus DSM 18391]|uniref:Uncharacterized protein n=1 Tax=Terriglobus roseus (strain DSM 18391 / NRRL B-41598 / KBS 63) TaxID=926566 RepID=I3ZIF4_TERRK|nr:hypothetical protein Terro_2786 [Terriglobus roseus DSM 18391]